MSCVSLECGTYAFTVVGAAAEGSGLGPPVALVNACRTLSRNEKKTSTAYPTRKAIANGEREAVCVTVKLLNRPTTAPLMPATRKRAELATEGVNVLVRICSSNDRSRYAQVPNNAYSAGRMHAATAP